MKSTIRTVGICLWSAVACAFLSVPGHADVYTVAGVEVDATADSAAAARVKAIAEGQQVAFGRLMDRLVPAENRSDVAPPSSAELQTLVQDFGIDSERSSPVRYLARLRIRFDAGAVRNRLRNAGIPFAETASGRAVILPVLLTPLGARLWEPPNLWLDAWLIEGPAEGLISWVVPDGGGDEVRLIDAAQAALGDEEALRGVAALNDARGVIVAVARLSDQQVGGGSSVEVTLRDYGTGVVSDVAPRLVVARPGETLDDLIQRAVGETRRAMERDWQQANLLRFDVESTISLRAPLRDLGDFVEVTRRLQRLPIVVGQDLVALRRSEAEFSVRFLGSEDQLRRALGQVALAVADGEDGPQLIRTDIAPPPQDGSPQDGLPQDGLPRGQDAVPTEGGEPPLPEAAAPQGDTQTEPPPPPGVGTSEPPSPGGSAAGEPPAAAQPR